MLLTFYLICLFVYGLVSAKVERSVFTGPIVFVLAGAVLSLGVEVALPREEGFGIFLRMAEAGLVLLLFTDASRTPVVEFAKWREWPGRLLGFGLPLTIGLGALAAALVFPELPVWEACILAAILAPTDAGLGQVIVSSERVPKRVREALNVEAGLNDGLSVPFLLFFIAMAAGAAHGGEANLLHFVKEQLGYGLAVGGGIGLTGGLLLGLAHRAKAVSEEFLQISVVVLPALCIPASNAVGASMFIAAFVAGLVVQVGFRHAGRHAVEFTEEWGQILNLGVFFLFGGLFVSQWEMLGWQSFAYAALSLTVVRMLPVAAALAGARLDRSTVLFMGWFGPRGLASIVLGLVYLEEQSGLVGRDATCGAVMATVLVSVLAHGFSAKPGIAWLERRQGRLADGQTGPSG